MLSEFKKLSALVGRNIKLYFKDKMTFFISLLTPIILVVLFLTFLKGVYANSIISTLPEGMEVSNKAIEAFCGGWLFSSIVSVSCVTVAFCSNIMVLDKINKSINDLNITPVKKSTLLISYFTSNFLTTFLICVIVLIISFIYLACVGFFLTFFDVFMLFVSTICMCLFGSLLASIVGMLVSSQGAHSAVSSLVSSMYGFISGAYMPISQFGVGLKTFLSFLPSTFGTVLFRQYYMNGVINHLQTAEHVPAEIAEQIRLSFDGKFVLFDTTMPTWALFTVVVGTSLLLLGLYILISHLKKRKLHQKEYKKAPNSTDSGTK